MARTVFQEFDQFADAINGIAGRFVPTGRAQSDWWVQVVPVGGLAIQQVQIGGASIFAGDGRDRAVTLGIPVTAPQRIRIDGDELGPQSFIAVREGQPFTFAARHTTRWAGVTIPVDDPVGRDIADALCFTGATSSPSGTHTRAHAAQVARLRSLVTRICANDDALAPTMPRSRALEEEILVLAARMLQAGGPATSSSMGRPRYNRERVIARVLELLDARQGQPLLLRDLCEGGQVSERTLRTIFHEYFGVGPMRLVKLRRLHEVHRALLSAEVRHERVSDILGRFGVADPTVFARNYKAIYGELPSQTLRRNPTSPRYEQPLPWTWLRYATRKFESCAHYF